jgi:hypothetical protein
VKGIECGLGGAGNERGTHGGSGSGKVPEEAIVVKVGHIAPF